MGRLTDKQRKFCQLVVQGLTAKDAYQQAGYSATSELSLRVNASQMLDKPDVIKYLQGLRGKIEAEHGITVNWIVERFKENIERGLQHQPVLDSEGNPTGTYKYDGHVVNKALESLARWQKMFDVTAVQGEAPVGKRVIRYSRDNEPPPNEQ